MAASRLILLAVPLLVAGDIRGDPTPLFSFNSASSTPESHYAFGLALGARFKTQIASRVANSSELRDSLLPFYGTPEGKAAYQQFLSTHQRVYPLYLKEIEGIAHSSGVSFSTLFIQNLALEYGTLANPTRQAVDACSDYQLCTPERCVVGHNDDNDFSLLNHTALVTATFGGVTFTGFTYLGDLTTGAFGWNNQGVAVTLNWVGPTNVLKGGLGRNFISRSVLDAASFQDAVSRITVPNQSSGHNYQLMDFKHRQVANIETGPGQLFAYRAIEQPFFHANQYLTLQLPQHFANSSVHRTARARELPLPYDASAVLDILGDQHDTLYPIFHDELSHQRGELSDWTLATVLFDLDNSTVTLYHGNPSKQEVMYRHTVL